MMRIIILFTAIFCLSNWAFGQKKRELEKIRQLNFENWSVKQRQLNMRLDTAIQLSKEKSYLAADKIFMDLLKKKEKISSELVYYFGRNSFYLKKYAQSIDWLNKYIQLKGMTSKFSQDALKYLKKSEQELVKSKTPQRNIIFLDSLYQNDYINCGSIGKIICPVCKGTTVIITRRYNQSIYKTCPYCQYRGYLECEKYNQLIRGKLNKYNVN